VQYVINAIASIAFFHEFGPAELAEVVIPMLAVTVIGFVV
jgi:hypothetical protein